MKMTKRFLSFILAVSAAVTIMLAMGITASAAEDYLFDLSVQSSWDINEVEYNYTQSTDSEVKLNITGCAVEAGGYSCKILSDNDAGTTQTYKFTIPEKKVITRVEFIIYSSGVINETVNIPVDENNQIVCTVKAPTEIHRTLYYGEKQVSDDQGYVYRLKLYLEDKPYTETAVSVSKGIAYSDSYAFVVVTDNGYDVKDAVDDTVKAKTADFEEKNVMTVFIKSTDANVLNGKKLYIKTGSNYLFEEGFDITKSTALKIGDIYYTMIQIVSDEINSEATYTVEIK